MSRISTPSDIAASPAASQPLLAQVRKSLGSVPNMFRLIGNSPAALEGYLALRGALAKGDLPAATAERIALAIANINGCTYCNSAHGMVASRVARLDDAEIAANRAGHSNDPKADAAVRFAVKVARQRGEVTEEDLRLARLAGHGDAQLVEIVLHVALNTLTNYVNEVFATEVDFPLAPAARAS